MRKPKEHSIILPIAGLLLASTFMLDWGIILVANETILAARVTGWFCIIVGMFFSGVVVSYKWNMDKRK